MSPKTKDWLRTWISPITTVVTSLGLLWSISLTIAGTVKSELQELHQDTRDIKTVQQSFSEYKTDMKVDLKKKELHDDEQDNKLQADRIDITTLLTRKNK